MREYSRDRAVVVVVGREISPAANADQSLRPFTSAARVELASVMPMPVEKNRRGAAKKDACARAPCVLVRSIDLASDLPVSDKYLSSFGDWALMAASEHSRLEAALPAAVRDDAAALAT